MEGVMEVLNIFMGGCVTRDSVEPLKGPELLKGLEAGMV